MCCNKQNTCLDHFFVRLGHKSLLRGASTDFCLTCGLLYKYSSSTHLPGCMGFYYIPAAEWFQWSYDTTKTNKWSAPWFTEQHQRLQFLSYESMLFSYVYRSGIQARVSCQPGKTRQCWEEHIYSLRYSFLQSEYPLQIEIWYCYTYLNNELCIHEQR